MELERRIRGRVKECEEMTTVKRELWKGKWRSVKREKTREQ